MLNDPRKASLEMTSEGSRGPQPRYAISSCLSRTPTTLHNPNRSANLAARTAVFGVEAKSCTSNDLHDEGSRVANFARRYRTPSQFQHTINRVAANTAMHSPESFGRHHILSDMPSCRLRRRWRHWSEVRGLTRFRARHLKPPAFQRHPTCANG